MPAQEINRLGAGPALEVQLCVHHAEGTDVGVGVVHASPKIGNMSLLSRVASISRLRRASADDGREFTERSA